MRANWPECVIEPLSLEAIRKNPRNARIHSDRQIRKLAGSIAEFGFVVPVLVDEASVLLSGHARIAAAEQLGVVTVPAVRVRHLSQVQKRAFMVADNRLAELATWDEEILKQELSYLDEIDLDLSVVGFETAEVDLILDWAPSANTKEDSLPTTPPVISPVTTLGDVWLLDKHRLFCGDALDPHAYEVVLAGERARMAITDPPYNVPVDGHVGGLGGVKHREFAMGSGEMTQDQFASFLTAAMRNMQEHSIDGSIHFVFMEWRHIEELVHAGKQIFTELKNVCVWNKSNAGMGSFYRSKHELVFVFKNGTVAHTNNIALGAHGRYRTNVWDYPGVNGFGKERNGLLSLHPTVKPVALIADAIKDCTKRGDLVLDPFAGSGTCIIAAEKTKRRAAAIEIDRVYVDAIVRRWQTFTGKSAICAKTGTTFADREAAGLERAELSDDKADRHGE